VTESVVMIAKIFQVFLYYCTVKFGYLNVKVFRYTRYAWNSLLAVLHMHVQWYV